MTNGLQHPSVMLYDIFLEAAFLLLDFYIPQFSPYKKLCLETEKKK